MARRRASRPDEDLYRLWFGHDDVSFREKWETEDTAEYTMERIKQIPEAKTATHVRTFGQIPSDIHLLFPQVTNLKSAQPSSRQHISKLTNLKVLDMSENDFSAGLPDLFNSLLSLEKLDLRCCKLQTLPKSISKLTNLKVLDMTGNDFSAGLPDIFSSLLSLEKLELRYCKLQTLPKSISKLTNLKVLDMSDNDFSAGLPDILSSLLSLEKLELSGCKLQTLPKSISKLTNLKVLGMTFNDFTTGLPDIFSSLLSLERLRLAHCKLQTFPKSISKLTNLKVLDISYNDFSAGLPDIFSSPLSLEDLELRGCKLQTLPKSISKLTNLKVLDMSGNDFSAGLPDIFSSLLSLEELELKECKLQTLPKSISKLTNMKVLDMSDNDLSAGLPDIFSSLLSLEKLELTHCKLQTLPKSISKLTNLNVLDMSGNDFSAGLPDIFSSLLSLEKLKLTHCKLKTLPKSIRALDRPDNDFSGGLTDIFNSLLSLEELTLTECKLQTLPESIKELTNLKVLDISFNDCSAGLPDIFSSLLSLEELMLRGCKLQTLPKSIGKLTNLKVLDMSYNEFSAGLPDIFSSLLSLEKLELRWCRLRTLPKSISKLTNLKVLDMSDNDFSVGLPDIFSSLLSLEKLELRWCKLRTLPKSISKLTNLEILHMSDNEFSAGLPDIFSSLLSLEKLELRECKLQTLPKSISKLTNLKVLDMSNNDFSDGLPDIFSSLLSLEKWELTCCKLQTLPKSISKLTNLEILHMSGNDFSAGLPDIFSSLLSLEKLELRSCKLQTLPKSLGTLQNLRTLNLHQNNFKEIPDSVYNMRNLRFLDLSINFNLEQMNSKVLQLTKLQMLSLSNCNKIKFPPDRVCKQGVEAIRQFFLDMRMGVGNSLPLVTIAVIGNTMAGKTSLIKTLQNVDRTRVLTHRNPESKVDETTKIFKVEKLEIENFPLQLIDMGGNEIYHTTYQLALHQNCIPIIVVNMAQYRDLSQESSEREAVRRLAFDYMSHLYLANPSMGSPKLVLTHKDLFSDTEFAKLKHGFLNTSNQLCKEIVEEEKQLNRHCSLSNIFSDSAEDIFFSEDIYEFGKWEDYAAFDSLKIHLLLACQPFIEVIPAFWEQVSQRVCSLPYAYCTFKEIFNKLKQSFKSIKQAQFQVILNYMHQCGKVLWYENTTGLENYIFHNVPALTALLVVFYSHEGSRWSQRRESFVPFLDDNGVSIEVEQFDAFVKLLNSTAVMDKQLFLYLIQSETLFKTKTDLNVAVNVLKIFRLIYGPVAYDVTSTGFYIPYMVKQFSDRDIMSKEELSLQVDLAFKGLSLPQYAYHQMSVGMLELFPSLIASTMVHKDGASVFHDGLVVQLIHDYKSRKVSIYVSSAARRVCEMWKQLLNITNNALQHVTNSWPASRPVVLSFCAHCLLIQSQHPEKIVNPHWAVIPNKQESSSSTSVIQKLSKIFSRGTSTKSSTMLDSTSSQVVCKRETIFALLKFPHTSDCLPASESDGFTEFVKQLKSRGEQANAELTRQMNERLPVAMRTEDDLSELSEDDDIIVPEEDETHQNVEIRLTVTPTTHPKVKELFNNTNEVYRMTKKRGRALIINNEHFSERPDLQRKGSSADVENMTNVMKAFKFEVLTRQNLKAEEMLTAIKTEVENPDHEDYGCHMLVIMSHGSENNLIHGTDMKPIKLTTVFDLLTPLNFPGMAGKPKMVVLEVCSGVRSDLGERGIVTDPKLASASSKQVRHEVVPPPPSKIGEVQREAESMTRLNYDDLLVIKSSFESFLAVRHEVYGSLMIRALVSTMYKHAGHRHMCEIFKNVQQKVRKTCLKRQLHEGQLVVTYDTLTHGRQLYLFPGFNGHRRRE